MATTTNYSWETPDDTDLVKDGAAAIRTLGSSIDTTTKALNPSTTLGDIEYRSSTANTNTRLGIGSTGNVLTVTGGVPTWAAPATPTPTAANYTLLNSGGTALTGATTVTVSGISGKESILIFVDNASSADASAQMWIRFNGVTTTSYNTAGAYWTNPSSYSGTFLGAGGGLSDNKIDLGYMTDNASSNVRGYVSIEGCNSSGLKVFHGVGAASNPFSSRDQIAFALGGVVNTGAITSVSITSSSGNLDNGRIYVYAA